jgi:hypothetical protein
MGPAESDGISVAAAKAIATPCQIIFNSVKKKSFLIQGNVYAVFSSCSAI